MKHGLAFGRWMALATMLAGPWTGAASAAEPFRFVAIGDIPYSDREARILTDEVTPAIARGGFPFVIHVGDFKGGGESCTDARFEGAFKEMQALLPGRVFYTPGDNDWTDCDRDRLEPPMSELGRLALLRRMFFARPLKLPPDWAYARQPGFPENARWRHGGVQFVTLHVVGTNNGRIQILEDDPAVARDEVDRRDAANAAWLTEAFALADTGGAAALIIAMQADPTRITWQTPCTATLRDRCDAFAALREQLAGAAARFDRPVLLVHGDTAAYCLDQELGGRRAPKLWRLNNAGDGIAEATVVTVRPDEALAPFLAHRLLTGVEVRTVC